MTDSRIGDAAFIALIRSITKRGDFGFVKSARNVDETKTASAKYIAYAAAAIPIVNGLYIVIKLNTENATITVSSSENRWADFGSITSLIAFRSDSASYNGGGLSGASTTISEWSRRASSIPGIRASDSWPRREVGTKK